MSVPIHVYGTAKLIHFSVGAGIGYSGSVGNSLCLPDLTADSFPTLRHLDNVYVISSPQSLFVGITIISFSYR